MKTKTNYYENQLKRVNVPEGHTPSININHQTNWMDINEESALVLIEYLKKFIPKKTNRFPNGFGSWQETHFEVVTEITRIAGMETPYGPVSDRIETQGTGGLYELAEELTDEFELLNQDREWDGEFFEEIGEFLSNKLN